MMIIDQSIVAAFMQTASCESSSYDSIPASSRAATIKAQEERPVACGPMTREQLQ
jgi:hypothetical protein